MSALEDGHTLDARGLHGKVKLTKAETSRRSLAKFVELSRRRLGESLEGLAEKAAVDLGELLAAETGKGVVQPQTVQRLASFLGVNPQRLLQLAGLMPAENFELEQAALHFAARTESVRPLEPQEQAALERFCDEVFAVESPRD
jgi:transcriptional regulator with XRE-family HTH domain